MEYKGNKITRKSWNWLNVNESTIDLSNNIDKLENKKKDNKNNKEQKEIISIEMDRYFSKIDYGISKEIIDLNRNKLNKYIYLNGKELDNKTDIEIDIDKNNKNNKDKKENIKNFQISRSGAIRYTISNYDNLLIDIHLKENTEAIYILEFKQIFNLVTRIKLEKNSKLELILVDRERLNNINKNENKEARSKLESISVIVDENAQNNIIKVDFGEYNKYLNYTSDLIEENSHADITLTYVLNNKEEYDMSFNQRHIAKDTIGNIVIEGVLKDESSKIFKGTIDFRKGSKGSIGNEYESITNYSKNSKAISLPILLSHEDEIKGNHSSNHGKFDEEQIYYITSRGFTKEEAENIIAESKIIPILDKVKNRELKSELKKELKDKLGD